MSKADKPLPYKPIPFRLRRFADLFPKQDRARCKNCWRTKEFHAQYGCPKFEPMDAG